MVFMKRWRVLLGLALLGILAVEAGPGQPPLRTGTIVMGVPRDGFVVLGADRLWSNALPRSDDPPSDGKSARRFCHRAVLRHGEGPEITV